MQSPLKLGFFIQPVHPPSRPYADVLHEDREAVRAFSQLECEGERIARIRTYFHTPEAIAEVCRELGAPCRTNGYRFW